MPIITRQEQKGPFEGLIDKMSEEDIAKYAAAIRAGNDSIKYYKK